MFDLSYARDLVMTGAIFGVAAFVWAGWAQEKPPPRVAWRVILGLFSLAGAALAGITIPVAIRHWDSPTAIDPSTGAFAVYLTVFWVEVVLCAGLAFWAARRKRSDLIAPLILAIVGIHFLPLAPVFGQPIMAVAGVLLTAIAVVAALLPTGSVGRSFWCGILAAPVLLVIGAVCALAGIPEVREA
ncbi:hypothetical protein [Microbacterium sp. P03]|uniref:hypothetical protein n=1 Tax=Microbacterium sp. P03 TaxID=3366946 RepID=UPI00374592FB